MAENQLGGQQYLILPEGAIYRIKEPKAVIILFKNGKLICTGSNTTKDIKIVLERATKIISKYVIS